MKTKEPGAAVKTKKHAAPDIEAVQTAIHRAQQYLLDQQHPAGYWVAELEGDTILESEYLMLLYFLGRQNHPKCKKLIEYIKRKVLPEGGWSIYPGGPPEISASVKAYFVLKLWGISPDEEFMKKSREVILSLGGVENCNSYTKIGLSIFGQYDWNAVPTIPPEIILLPRESYFNIYEMSSWSRAIVVPLSIVWSYKPQCIIPEDTHIDELFKEGVHANKISLPWDKDFFSYRNYFLYLDQLLKMREKMNITPWRNYAIKSAEKWMLARFKNSGGLGAIFPPMQYSLIALKCLGYAEDSPEYQYAVKELEKFEIEEGDTMRVQPCFSPVWDTAITVNALVESGMEPNHPALIKACKWLLAKEVRNKGDWSVKEPHLEPGGWYFEFDNEFYPDVDDTIMVLMALHKVDYPDNTRKQQAIHRGINWVLAMQSEDGGWASFDKNNNKMVFSHVPFADHNAMLDPSTSDITARTLECLSYFGYSCDNRTMKKALEFLRKDQGKDGSWYGRWGVNYIYGTWQVLKGLNLIGFNMNDPMCKAGEKWLTSVQNPDGGWGETCESYFDLTLKGKGPSTASQTSWALMGLLSMEKPALESVSKGIHYLLTTQNPEGDWSEEWFTGTGFPKVFYLRYHYYPKHFPLWALGMYLQRNKKPDSRD